MGKCSTGFIKETFGSGKSTREVLKDFIMWGFSGTVPATADAAETGTRLVKFTLSGATVKAKQKIRITPTVGTASAAVWNVKLGGQDGVTVSITDDGTPTATEICTALYNALRVQTGVVAATTPAHTVNNPDVYQKFTFTDNTGTLDIEAATAGVSFEVSVSVSGAGAGTGSIATSTITEHAYGFRWEAYSGIESGELERLSGDEWKGTFLADGVLTHGRIQSDDDTGILSTSAVRLQGLIAVANSEITVTHVDGVTGEEVSASIAKLKMASSV